MRSTSLIATLAATATMGLAATAQADTYCVGSPASCPAGATSHPDVQAALQAARSHDGPDVVRIGAGTFKTADGFWYDDGNQAANTVEIIGAGPATILRPDQDTKSGDFETVRLSTENASRLAHVSVVAANRASVSDYSTGVELKDEAGAESIRVTGENPDYGIVADSGNLIDVEVDTPYSTGVHVNEATVAIFDSRIRARRGIVAPSGGSVMIRRTEIEADKYGAIMHGGVMAVESTLIRMTSKDAIALKAQGAAPDAALLKASHVTLVGDGSVGSKGVQAHTPDAANAEVQIDNSIIHGFDHGASRLDPAAGSGEAKVTGSNVNYAAANDHSQGDGDIDIDAVTNSDPGFADAAAGDYRLPRWSLMIGAARSASIVPTTENDLAGGARAVGAARDLGAYEYQNAAPVAVVDGGLEATKGQALALSGANSHDIDAGDSVTSWSWTFGDGSTANGKNVSHAWAADGIYEVKLTVQDETGKKHTAAVTVKVVAPPAPVVDAGTQDDPNKGSGTGTGTGTGNGTGTSTGTGTADTLAPALSGLKLNRAKGRLRLSLSEAATLRVRIERRVGRKFRGAVAAKRFSGNAGANTVKVATRKLRPGRYRVSVTAIDAAGNRTVKRLAFRVV